MNRKLRWLRQMVLPFRRRWWCAVCPTCQTNLRRQATEAWLIDLMPNQPDEAELFEVFRR